MIPAGSVDAYHLIQNRVIPEDRQRDSSEKRQDHLERCGMKSFFSRRKSILLQQVRQPVDAEDEHDSADKNGVERYRVNQHRGQNRDRPEAETGAIGFHGENEIDQHAHQRH